MSNANTQVSTNTQTQHSAQQHSAQAQQVQVTASAQALVVANKHQRLLAALAQQNQTRAQLMQASNFNAKNLSVALCNLKRAKHVISTTIVNNQRTYSLVPPKQQ
jgi:predicted Rossmann fold nucleotide-binding protein DprA/Smf involved in DNA uptake